MKNQDKETLSVLRMVKGAMQLEEINKKHELTDDEFIGVISKQIKTRKESILEFEKANRTDLIEKTNSEIEILPPDTGVHQEQNVGLIYILATIFGLCVTGFKKVNE